MNNMLYEAGEYFSPANPEWFNEWRRTVLAPRRSDLFLQTGPPHNLDSIKKLLDSLSFDKEATAYLSKIAKTSNGIEAVKRSVFALRILADLGLLVGDSATGTHFEKTASSLANLRTHSSQAYAMTFQLSVTRCKPAWDSIKRIAAEHDVSPVNLAKAVGLFGARLGTRWLYTILGIRFIFRP
jgi:hypothetical protein